jgi:DNA repair protein RadD
MPLRPYQIELDARRRASAARSVCVQLPTGAGKSLLIQRAAEDHASVLVLAHAEYLIDQLSELVSGQVIKAGVQHDGNPRVVGMVQTIARRDIPEPAAVIVDEAHHASSATYREILGRFPNARIYGFTATPQRLDGLGLDFDELICGPGYRELIDAGYLKPFEVMSVPSGVDLAGVRTIGGDYAREDVKTALRRSTIFGDVVEHYLAHCRHLGGHASFWPSIELAEAAAERFRSRGVACLPLHSKLPKELIRAQVANLRSGAIESLATVDMIGEGLDVPGLASVSLCRPTKSLTIYLQQSGRCNRGGDGVARIMDHVANWQRHGLPDDDREWSLDGRVKRRAEAGSFPIWTCPACWRCNRSTVLYCPCSEPKPRNIVRMEEAAAQLELITRADAGDIHELCSSPAEYRRFASLHGKQPTWAAYQWWLRGNRASTENVFLAVAGQVRPTMAEYLISARECDVHQAQALVYARLIGLRRGQTRRCA